MDIPAHASVHLTVPRQQGRSELTRHADDLGAAGHTRAAIHHSAPQVGVILRAGMIGKNRAVRYIGIVTGSGVFSQVRTHIHIGISRCNGIIEDPCAVGRVGCQIAFTLHKTAQIPSFHLVANILQRADAVEEGIFFVGNVSDFIFQIARFFISSFIMPRFQKEISGHPPCGNARRYLKMCLCD